jgi:nucleotide-binding universal stress UspA family protein
MRALVWLVEETWAATIDQARGFVARAEAVTLMYVIAADVEAVLRGARAGLLGRPPASEGLVAAASEQAARELVAAARERLGRECAVLIRHGRVEREVVAAAADFDLLVLARDGDRRRLGPRSLGPHARFVVDHAPCQVLLVWPDQPPGVSTIPPPPR